METQKPTDGFRSKPRKEGSVLRRSKMAVVVISSLTYALLWLVLLVLALIYLTTPKAQGEAPGPFKWPIIGNLHLLSGFSVPYQGFTRLAEKYGLVYSLQLGRVPAVVVQGLENIKEVLIHKGHQFDSRPDFDRYHLLFHGNKQNSLAFCDWSEVQRKRRDLLKDHTFPKVYTNNYQQFDRLVCEEIKKLIENIKDETNNNQNETKSNKTIFNKPEIVSKSIIKLLENRHVGTIVRFPAYIQNETRIEEIVSTVNPVDIKTKLLGSTGNIFMRYFCSTAFENTKEFNKFNQNFDEIFYEVNQGYAYDFLPFLGVFHKRNLRKVQNCSREIRRFILENVIKDRMDKLEECDVEKDYVDAILKNVKFGSDVTLDLETALFSLEDIIGGHCAVANFLVKLLTFVVRDKTVQKKIKEEVERRGKGFISLEDRQHMPYTEAVVMETLRMLSSPIVPHVANQDTTIADYTVKKGTLVFLNNYELNMSEELWREPKSFDPSRFINPETGSKSKPVHFLPFGGGKRSCMGYKLVHFLSFVFVANVIGQFDVMPISGERYQQVPIGNLALPTQTYKFGFQIR